MKVRSNGEVAGSAAMFSETGYVNKKGLQNGGPHVQFGNNRYLLRLAMKRASSLLHSISSAPLLNYGCIDSILHILRQNKWQWLFMECGGCITEHLYCVRLVQCPILCSLIRERGFQGGPGPGHNWTSYYNNGFREEVVTTSIKRG